MRLAAAILLFLVPLSCGYSAGQISSGRGRTLAIPMFTNRTLRRDLERDLTRFVREEAAARTSYSLVDGSAADVVVTGKLVDVNEDVLSDRSKGGIRESSVVFTVVVTVTDRTGNRSGGRKIVDGRRMVERASFVPVKGESLRTAEVLVMRRIAERVVYSLSSEW
ncbi:MAG: LPS assembly lipoprotein LptE [Planctomycetota bacterium]